MALKHGSEEHRQSKRYSIDGCAVRSREKHLLGLFSKLSKKNMVLDISKSGIHFISRERFKKGHKVSLIITAPLLKDEEIQTDSNVIRVKKFPGVETYGIGAEFVDMDIDNRNRLKKLLKSVAKSDDDISSFIDVSASQK